MVKNPIALQSALLKIQPVRLKAQAAVHDQNTSHFCRVSQGERATDGSTEPEHELIKHIAE
jgi:hypothetical protein